MLVYEISSNSHRGASGAYRSAILIVNVLAWNYRIVYLEGRTVLPVKRYKN